MSSVPQVRVMLIGGEAGKTAVAVRFVKNTFGDKHDPATQHQDSQIIFRKNWQVDNVPVQIDLYDTPTYKTQGYKISGDAKHMHVFFIVFSIASRESFDMVKQIHADICKAIGTSDFYCVLAGNQQDMGSQRKVPEVEAENLAKSIRAQYVAISAKSGLGVTRIFEKIVRDLLHTAGGVKVVTTTTTVTKTGGKKEESFMDKLKKAFK